jgi:hypothetical protein
MFDLRVYKLEMLAAQVSLGIKDHLKLRKVII